MGYLARRTKFLVSAGLLAASAITLVLVMVALPAKAQRVTAAAVGSVTRYVATTGTDAADCSTSTSPCKTVQYAVDIADEGDEIRVASGVYTGINSYGGRPQVVHISK